MNYYLLDDDDLDELRNSLYAIGRLRTLTKLYGRREYINDELQLESNRVNRLLDRKLYKMENYNE